MTIEHRPLSVLFYFVPQESCGEAGFTTEMGEADKRLSPPVKGWEFFTSGKWTSGDQTLECSRHLSAELAGKNVPQNYAMFILNCQLLLHTTACCCLKKLSNGGGGGGT